MRLHYLPGTAAMAPHATLAEIGVPYELVRVERDEDGRPSDAYLALKLSSPGTTTGSTRTLQVRRGRPPPMVFESRSCRYRSSRRLERLAAQDAVAWPQRCSPA